MSDIVIKAENLGKMYTIGHQAENRHYVALRDVIMQNVRTLWNKTKDLATGKAIIQGDTMEEVWALKDVSFEIKRGEAVGIIGRNGAGKSTLLKVLSRITEPSTGRVTIKGRVASLLEVGTGFHPELTGRENIYLNGAILGMTRAEIKRKFDEIVSFAEMEKYLDTPVKRYSSGMYVRLAFAVAAHLEPEILLVDEVLSVGDAQFQKKCLGKMGNVAQEGRTVLFVSHNLQIINGLCQETIWIEKGNIKLKHNSSQVISEYIRSQYDINFENEDLENVSNRSGNGRSKFTKIYFLNSEGRKTMSFEVGGYFSLVFCCKVIDLNPAQFYQIRIITPSGTPVYHWVDFDDDFSPLSKSGMDTVRIELDKLLIYPGKYYVSLLVSDRYGVSYDYLENIASFDVVSGSKIPMKRQYFPNLGLVHQIPRWSREGNLNVEIK